MRQLNDEVARIEIRTEQILFYLRSDRNSPKAAFCVKTCSTCSRDWSRLKLVAIGSSKNSSQLERIKENHHGRNSALAARRATLSHHPALPIVLSCARRSSGGALSSFSDTGEPLHVLGHLLSVCGEPQRETIMANERNKWRSHQKRTEQNRVSPVPVLASVAILIALTLFATLSWNVPTNPTMTSLERTWQQAPR